MSMSSFHNPVSRRIITKHQRYRIKIPQGNKRRRGRADTIRHERFMMRKRTTGRQLISE